MHKSVLAIPGCSLQLNFVQLLSKGRTWLHSKIFAPTSLVIVVTQLVASGNQCNYISHGLFKHNWDVNSTGSGTELVCII